MLIHRGGSGLTVVHRRCGRDAEWGTGRQAGRVLSDSDIPGPLRDVAEFQAGVVSRQQAFEAGLTRAAIAWQLQRARWQQLLRGVYAVFTGEPSREAVLWAAVLRVGRDAMLSHHTAAELAHLTDKPSELLHVSVPADRRVQAIPGLVIHRYEYADRARHPSLLPPRTRVEETVLDLAGLAKSFDDACGWVTLACGRRLTTEARLRAAMAVRGRMRWRSQLAELLGDPDGGLHSVLEYRYFRDVERAHRLPRSARQVRVVSGGRVRYRDAVYERFLVVVELDGQAAHSGESRWLDIRRDNAAAAAGGVTLRYGWADVTGDPCRIAAEVARALAARGWPGAPQPCRTGCRLAVTDQAGAKGL
jgi:very-short-patch-repair endonuclease